MEIFYRNKIILAVVTFPLKEIKIIFTHLGNKSFTFLRILK
jgi:hypothetical protein